MSPKLLIFLLLTLSVLGCTPIHQGGTATPSISFNKTIINECVTSLARLYPPAQTQLDIRQPATDAFGLSLIKSLRQKGYSINESSTLSAYKNPHHMAFYYIVDEPIKEQLYRITFIIGTQSLSRAYQIKNETLSPVGLWVRKE